MNCENGHTMVPICEYKYPEWDEYVKRECHKRGIKHSKFVRFKCLRCGEEKDLTGVEYEKYVSSREASSGLCPKCGARFWGRTTKRCPKCHSEFPYVPRKEYSNATGLHDDPWLGGFTERKYRGHLYIPAEWQELQKASIFKNEQE